MESNASSYCNTTVSSLINKCNKNNLKATHINEVETPKAVLEVKKNIRGTDMVVAVINVYENREPEAMYTKYIDNTIRSQIIEMIIPPVQNPLQNPNRANQSPNSHPKGGFFLAKIRYNFPKAN